MGSSAETASRLGKWLGSVRRWYRIPQPAIAPSRSIGLALGGGFARGIAHVGVLRVFEQYQIPIKYIAGVSAGSMVAAAYASGATPDEIGRIGAAMRFADVARWRISKIGLAGRGPPYPFPPHTNRSHIVDLTLDTPRVLAQPRPP